MQHEELTHNIIGAAMEVHRILGNGFQEVIYQRALAIELEKRGINFSREHEMPIHYKGHVLEHAASISLLRSKLWWK